MPFPSDPPTNFSGDNSDDNLADANLLKAILPPLLKDFQHWFASSVEMLETRNISFLSEVQKHDLLQQIQKGQQQVSAAQMMSSATDSQAGIEMSMVMGWHKLVHQCWGIALRSRKEQAAQTPTDLENTDLENNEHEPTDPDTLS